MLRRMSQISAYPSASSSPSRSTCTTCSHGLLSDTRTTSASILLLLFRALRWATCDPLSGSPGGLAARARLVIVLFHEHLGGVEIKLFSRLVEFS